MTNKSLSVILTLAVLFLSSAPLSATSPDKYDDYQKQFENAAPPPYFQKIKERKLTTPDAEHQDKNAVHDSPARFKKREQNAGASDFVREFTALPERTVRLNEEISDDPLKIEKHLEKELELDLLTALSLARNPGLATALEKKKAALNQYSQAANLQEILNQYLAFAEAVNTRVGPRQTGL